MPAPRKWSEEGKFCTDCGEVKPLAEFYRTERRGRVEFSTRCKPHHVAYCDQHRLAKYGGRAEARWFERYGLTVEQYHEMLEAQDGGCAICGRFPRGGKMDSRLHVDHDHETGAIRGLLCRSCNTALHLLDDPVKRDRALAYLGLQPAGL